ncbi:MAG: T9SS type A sorting domain-containing protein [bacterium]|nr:MAG: T9SS type A sorting domain-containing protein [bacterium]
MRELVTVFVCICVVAAASGAVAARDSNRAGRAITRTWSPEEFVPPEGFEDLPELMTSAQVCTFCIVSYDFEIMNWQGWTQVDNTAQVDTFSHVDDFSGLGGGSFGRLEAIEGTQSMWCGTRPNPASPYLCSWQAPPGYGNEWDQELATIPFSFVGPVTLSYHGRFDSETGYDYIYIDCSYPYDPNIWYTFASFDGVVDTVAVHTLYMAQRWTKLRFHFVSDGVCSDQDACWDSDGAFIVDSITVSDLEGVIDFEDWEDEPLGAKVSDSGFWKAGVPEPFGIYSWLENSLIDKDPCSLNSSSQIVFFLGSDEPSTTYPGLFDTEFCLGSHGLEAPCHDEAIVSPVIDMTQYSSQCDDIQDASIPPADLYQLRGGDLRFTVYRDLPMSNCVFYYWSVRNIDATGCPGPWVDRNLLYYGDKAEYHFASEPIGDLVWTDAIQVRLGCVDMCDIYFNIYCTCESHTPAPWFDNVRIFRYKSYGPQWSYRDFDLFQDKFPCEEFDLESYCRADMALDLDQALPAIRPGDSIVVTCSSPHGGGLRETASGPEVYMHVKAEYIGPSYPPWGPKPQYLYGPTLEGTYGHYDSDDGTMWTIIQAETVRTPAGTPVPGRYMFDLNDSLFTRGYMISYYFEAYDNSGQRSTLPQYAEWNAGRAYGTVPYKQVSYIFEWTCLPTMLSDILFVDGYHGVGTPWGMAEQYWNPSFLTVIPSHNYPDRYDINSPTTCFANGLGHTAKPAHLQWAYKKIFWDSGDLEAGTVMNAKCGDTALLIGWMNYAEHDCGLWICGDDFAADPLSAPLLAACGTIFVGDSYFALTGGIDGAGDPIPLITGAPVPSIFAGDLPGELPDTFIADGDCPHINGFDYLEKTGSGDYALEYPPYQSNPYYYAIQSEWLNYFEYTVRTMWFGSGFQYIRDAHRQVPIARNSIMEKVVDWMENITNPDITGDDGDAPPAYSLKQNFPNPFNPSTSIRFTMRERGHVTLRIYNVAGQLVRTLVDEVRKAGTYAEPWDGRNDLGKNVTSGIYFYKMETKNFSRSRKMVLLK